MSVSALRRRSVRIICAVIAAAGTTAGVASASALAVHRQPQPRLEIVRPYYTHVSGTIFLSVRGINPSALRVMFSIDGRLVWSVGRRSPRLRHTTAIDTRRLGNGRHVLVVRVTFRRRRTLSVGKTIVVHNRTPAGAQAHRASANPAGTRTGTGKSSSAGKTPSSGAGKTPSTGSGNPPVTVTPPTPGTPGPSVALFNRTAYGYVKNLPDSVEAGRYQYIVLQGSDYREIPILKAYNPNLKFLVYQAISFTNSNDYSWMQTVTGCTAYADDVANHPSWLQHDQNGNTVIARGYGTFYMTDLGNPAYQQTCATNAINLAKQYGFDGIFWDTADGNLGDFLGSGVSVPEYPTQASWQAAMGSALAYLGAAMHAAGLLSIANISSIDQATWEQWAGYNDGVEEESWTDGGLGLAQQIPYFQQKLAELSWTAAHQKYEILHSFNAGETPDTFGLAAMLLAANGYASYSVSNANNADETWWPEYGTAQQLGAPTGPYTILANGVYERAFANGIVLVNPTGSSVPSFSLGGGSYSGSGLMNVQSVSLGPTTALILLKTG